MATYDYISYITFDERGGSTNYGKGASVDVTGTLDDLEPDTTFEVGDPIYEAGGSQIGTFAGTYGASDLVVVRISATELRLYSFNASGTTLENTLPNNISSNDFTTTDFPTCFAAGTLIAGPDGPRAVEELGIGDRLLTADGSECVVRWVGRQTVSKRFTPRERFEPVCIAAGALAPGQPERDLVLTADHALCLDGVLVQACALVNGTTIRKLPAADLPERVTYYHVETDGHALVLAEGVPAETFMDNVSRRLFDNYADYEALYGADDARMDEMDLPRVMSPRQLPRALRERLNKPAAA